MFTKYLLHPIISLSMLGITTAVAAAPLQQEVYNVRRLGAKADGVSDDSAPVQAAIDAAENNSGGSVYLPAGTYLVKHTIVVGSNVEIYGDGSKTVLVRSDDRSPVNVYGGTCGGRSKTEPMTITFINRHYNCADTGIYLHDMVLDGSTQSTVPQAVMIAFSGLRNSRISHLLVRDSPQDSIFIRNGGENVEISYNTIINHNRLWGNGGGINVEMHKEGQVWGAVNIHDNHVVSGASNFCAAKLDQACHSNLQCIPWGPPLCGRGASTSAAIELTWVDGPHPAQARIVHNSIEVGNGHDGILCNGCADTEISGNTIRTLEGTAGRDSWNASFNGISSNASSGKLQHDLIVSGNDIIGSGTDEDGSGIVLRSPSDRPGLRLRVENNSITNKQLSAAKNGIEVTGWRNVRVAGNKLSGVCGHLIVLGQPGYTTESVEVTDNDLMRSHSVAQTPVELRAVSRAQIRSNALPSGSLR